MVMQRRAFLAAVAAGTAIAGAAAGAEGPPDIGIYCEPTVALAIRAAGALFQASGGGPVAVLTAPASLILAQVRQNPAHDLLVLPAAAMDEAAARKTINTATRRDAWKNALVIAARAGEVGDEKDLGRLLATGRIAATDSTAASTLDGIAVLETLGLTQALAGRTLGAANTADVAFMVRTGAARFGLLFLTDVRADPELAVALPLDPAKVPPAIISVALNTQPHGPNAAKFFAFLNSPDCIAKLAQLGLEAA